MMQFSLFSVLDYYEDGSCTLHDRYEQLLDQIVYASNSVSTLIGSVNITDTSPHTMH